MAHDLDDRVCPPILGGLEDFGLDVLGLEVYRDSTELFRSIESFLYGVDREDARRLVFKCRYYRAHPDGTAPDDCDRLFVP